MRKPRCRWIIGLLTVALAGFLLSACAAGGSKSKEEGIAPNIIYQVPDSAQLTKVAYFFKQYKGAERLHMEITLKNISSETQRFRVNIFLPEGPSGGGLYPRKVKEGAEGIAAGQELTRTFPMYFDRLPSGFTLMVKELG